MTIKNRLRAVFLRIKREQLPMHSQYAGESLVG